MNERHGLFSRVLQYRKASAAVVGSMLIALSLFNAVSLILIRHAAVRVPFQFGFFLHFVPDEAFGVAIAAAFVCGTALLLFAMLAWALDS